MNRVLYIRNFTAVLLMLKVLTVCAAEKTAGLEIGIIPFLPIKTLVQNYAPLRDYLQNKLNEPVTIVSAPDYYTYQQRIQNHEYPIIITSTSSAYLAWSESAYIPLLQPLNFTQAVVVVLNDHPFKRLSDLRDKMIALPDAMAVISMQGIQMLREAGLEPGRNVSINYHLNHSAAVNHVISGEAAAAIVSNRVIMQMTAAVRERVKIVHTWEKDAAPGIVYLGSADMTSDQLEKIQGTILEFTQTTPEGQKLMTDMGYGGLKSIGPAEMRTLAPYGALLKKAMSHEP